MSTMLLLLLGQVANANTQHEGKAYAKMSHIRLLTLGADVCAMPSRVQNAHRSGAVAVVFEISSSEARQQQQQQIISCGTLLCLLHERI